MYSSAVYEKLKSQFAYFANKKVLVTGGAGFIGSALARALVDLSAQVVVIDFMNPNYGANVFNLHTVKNRIQFFQTDLRDRTATDAIFEKLQGFHFIFQLAAQIGHTDSMQDPHNDLSINVLAHLNVLEATRKFCPQARSVFTSTRQIYGRPEKLPVDELHPIRPVDVNGINKYSAEQYSLLYMDVYKLPVSILRLTNTYGPGMRVKDARQTFVGVWVRNAIEGRQVLIYGDGTQARDFNFVDDVVCALLAAATENAAIGEVFNLGSPEVVSLNQLGGILTEQKKDVNLKHVDFPGERKAIDIGNYYGDYTKAQTLLHWKPQIDLHTGLKTTLEFYSQHRAHYWETT